MLLLVVLTLAPLIASSPFKLADNYIEEYKVGIAHFKREAHEYHPEERSYAAEFHEKEVEHEEYEYDFIIVGGGTSGSVIASRLSEVPEYKVLVLEAGCTETDITKIPAMAEVVRSSRMSWNYKTEPETSWCLGNGEHRCELDSGKVLGGTSGVNDLIYSRGNSRDFDLWADNGNTGWCNGDTLPYFMKSENAALEHFDRKHHYQGGLLNVEDPRYLSPLHEHFLHAGKELGYNVLDYNGKEQLGFSVPQMNTKGGQRYSTYEGYIAHFGKRKNLVVLPKSQVIEILISPHSKDAQGVKYVHGDHVKVAKAKREVILAGGALNTAQLLKLSGIGPKHELEAHHIDCNADLPVGHIKDHPSFSVVYEYNSTHHEEDPEHNLISYLRDGKGPLTITGVEALAFLKTKASLETADYPDIQLSFIPDIYHSTFKVKITLLHPKSTGYLKLKSSDPLNYPSVKLNQFSDEDDHDIHTMLAGIRLVQKLCETHSFHELGAHLHEHQIEGCPQEFNSDAYWSCAIRHVAYSEGHFMGTANMGPKPEHSVVDNHLNVHGINKLRVADASVIPVTISGDIHATVVMIGEKASDLIRNKYEHFKIGH